MLTETQRADLARELERAGVPTIVDEPMYRHTSLRLGGPADLFCTPGDEKGIQLCLKMAKEAGLPVTLVGQGSNLLVKDGGIRGLVMKCAINSMEIRGNIMEAGSGCLLSKLAEEAAKASLSGLAFASGIPGSLGGAVYMNAGAYGGEIRDVFLRASALTMEGDKKELDAGDMQFDYRYCALQDHPLILTRIVLALKEGNEAEIREVMRENTKKRQEKQPLNVPSAGSTFRRPRGDFAARLIDVCGLRGLACGGAQVSEKHTGFLVNRGGTAADFLALMDMVHSRVLQETGVDLKPEVRIVGEDAGEQPT